MKVAFVQISGGVGAQIIGCIATKALRDKGYYVFIDGRYFGRLGKKSIPKGITYFDKELSDSILKFSIFEKNRFVCRLTKVIFLIGLKFFPRSIVFYEDISDSKKTAVNEAAEYINNSKASNLLREIKTDLFTQSHHTSQSDVVAHIRRGDYIEAGLPTTSLGCIFSMVKKMVLKDFFDLLIVTDSPQLIKSELNNNLQNNVNVVIQRSELLNDLNTLINAKKFVASDSQFSLVAVWLSETIKKVACPIRFKHENLIKPSNYDSIDWY